jgi:hypothetical protein
VEIMSDPALFRTDLYHGLFRWEQAANGQPTVSRHPEAPVTIPDPQNGRQLRVATVDARTRAICPSCASDGQGGFVSFVQDLRLAYACPSCKEFVWLTGA